MTTCGVLALVLQVVKKKKEEEGDGDDIMAMPGGGGGDADERGRRLVEPRIWRTGVGGPLIRFGLV